MIDPQQDRWEKGVEEQARDQKRAENQEELCRRERSN